MRKKLQNEQYVKFYENDPEFMDFDAFQCLFYFNYLVEKSIDTKQQHENHAFLCILNDIFLRYKEIMSRNNTDWKFNKSHYANTFSIYFSRFGQYKKAYQAFKLQYIKDDYNLERAKSFKSCIHSYLAVNEYSDAINMIINMLIHYKCYTHHMDKSETTEILNEIMFISYLFRVYAEKEIYKQHIGDTTEAKSINKATVMYLMLNKEYSKERRDELVKNNLSYASYTE